MLIARIWVESRHSDAGKALDGDSAWRKHRVSRRTRRSNTAKPDKDCSDVSALQSRKYCTASDLRMLRLEVHSRLSNSGNIPGRNVYKSALFAAVVEDYLGGTERCSKSLEIDTQRWSEPQTKAEESGSDALILLYVGSTTRDPRVLQEGQKRHIAGIQRLRTELVAQKYLDGVLAAAQVIFGCEYYSAVSSGCGPDSWNSHVNGISALVRAVGDLGSGAMPESRKYSFQQARHIAFIHAIVCRRETPGLQYWQNYRGQLLMGNREILVHLALRLPALLQRMDFGIKQRHTNSQYTDSMISNVCSSLQRLKADFISWQSDAQKSGHDFSFWEDDNEAMVYRTRDRPGIALVALRFSSNAQATYLTLYWVCLLLLQQALLRLSNPGSKAGCKLITNIDWCADMLCRSIPYLLETADGPISKALAVRGQIHFAIEWWRTRNEAKLLWCREIGLRLRKELPYLNWDALLRCSFSAIYNSPETTGVS